jgi:hypothetical protein
VRRTCLRTIAVVLLLAIFPALARADQPPPPTARSWVSRAFEHLRLPPKIKKVVDNRMLAFRARCTRIADRIECRLPAGLRPAFDKARYLNPLTLSAFCVRKFKQDPIFLTAYGVVSTAVGYAVPPLLMAAGVSAFPALVAHEVIGTPLTLGVIAWRQHHLRQDRSQTFLQTARKLFGEYRDFALQRRADARSVKPDA